MTKPEPVVLASMIRQLEQKWRASADEIRTYQAACVTEEYAARLGHRIELLTRCADELSALLAAPVQAHEEPNDVRTALDSLLQRRGVAILEHVRSKDRELGYQVGMLLDDIARIANVNSPSLPAVPLAAVRSPQEHEQE